MNPISSAMQPSGAVGAVIYPSPQNQQSGQHPWYDPYTMQPRPVAMISMRLGVHPHYPPPFPFIEAHKLDDTRVAVFLVANGKALIIEDDAGLFPSDTLITQLRMLMDTK